MQFQRHAMSEIRVKCYSGYRPTNALHGLPFAAEILMSQKSMTSGIRLTRRTFGYVPRTGIVTCSGMMKGKIRGLWTVFGREVEIKRLPPLLRCIDDPLPSQNSPRLMASSIRST